MLPIWLLEQTSLPRLWIPLLLALGAWAWVVLAPPFAISAAVAVWTGRPRP